MKLILDISNILHSAFKMNWEKNKPLKELENMCRHIVVTTIYTKIYDLKVKQEDVIIAVDARGTWRNDYFPLYKHKRKVTRDKSEIDAKLMYQFFNDMVDELAKYFPFHVMKVKKCEADDIIGVLARYLSEKKNEEVIIVSRDKDFLQLINKKISLFDPFEDSYTNVGKIKTYKMAITTAEHSRMYRMLHILIGDSIDGIMNVLSPDHILAFPKMVMNKKGDKMVQERQPSLGWKKIEKELLTDGILDPVKYKDFIKQTKEIELLKKEFESFKITEEVYNVELAKLKAVRKNFIRNRTLIDLEMVPVKLKEEIVDIYKDIIENPTPFHFNTLSKYFCEYGLDNLNIKLMTGRLVRTVTNIKKLF
jgi:5'-3' exonuclease